MKRAAVFLSALLAMTGLTGAKPSHTLETVKAVPKGLSKKVVAVLDPTTYRIRTDKGAVCEIWFVKSAAVKKATGTYSSFAEGQLLGALRVGKAAPYTDFRGQELKPGTYTLRYGKQPVDGNHVGTSELPDFLLALPAKTDTDPKTLTMKEMFHKQSAKAAGTTHPAIFALLPGKKTTKVTLSHDEDKELWILSVTVNAAAKDKKAPVPLTMVAVGKTDE
ncbi:MAG: hypothetical protein ACE5KM_00195 [Planctomycetaceae bacterium]